MVLLEQLSPRRVADLDRSNRGVDDVAEEDGAENPFELALGGNAGPGLAQEGFDLVQHRPDVRKGRDVTFDRKLDEGRARDSSREVAAALDLHPAVLGIVDDKRWYTDGG